MDKEIWKNVIGFEGRYQVSNFGRVKGIHKMLKFCESNGYARVYFFIKKGKQKGMLVHRLVAAAFIGKIEQGLEVNHIDGNKKNNKVDNLEVVTRSQNVYHSHYTLKNNNLHKPEVSVYCYEYDVKCKSVNEMKRFLNSKQVKGSVGGFAVKCSRYKKRMLHDMEYMGLHFTLHYDK